MDSNRQQSQELGGNDKMEIEMIKKALSLSLKSEILTFN